MYTTSQLAELFHINDQTVKRYSGEFRAYLSPTATPEHGSTRLFTDDDLAVYDLIVSMKKDRKQFEQIHAALKSGRRGTVPDTNVNDLALAPTNTELRLMNELKELRTEVQRLRNADAQNELLKEQLDHAQQEIRKLEREIGRLEPKE